MAVLVSKTSQLCYCSNINCAYQISAQCVLWTSQTYIIWILCFQPQGVSKLLPYLILPFTPCIKMNAQKCWGGQPPEYRNSHVPMEMGFLRGKLSCSFNTKVHSHDEIKKFFLMCPFLFLMKKKKNNLLSGTLLNLGAPSASQALFWTSPYYACKTGESIFYQPRSASTCRYIVASLSP